MQEADGATRPGPIRWLAGLIVGVTIALVGIEAAAAERIGIVDGARVYENLSDLKAATARAEAAYGPRVTKLQADRAALDADIKRFEREGPSLGESQRQERAETLSRRQSNLTREAEDLTRAVNRQRELDLNAVQPRISEALRLVATREQVVLILEKTNPGIYYAADSIDLTDRVVATYEELLRKP